MVSGYASPPPPNSAEGGTRTRRQLARRRFDATRRRRGRGRAGRARGTPARSATILDDGIASPARSGVRDGEGRDPRDAFCDASASAKGCRGMK